MTRSRPARSLLIALTALSAFALAPVAARAEKVVTMPGFNAPGTPAKYNKVRVLEQGKANAHNVLVLAPGTQAGGGYFRPLAADIVAKLPGWQVWSVERRENLLEDHSVLDQFLAGTKTAQQTFDYYLGWIGNPNPGPHFTPVADKDVEYAKSWGMNVAVQDLHRVVAQAKKGGRTVVLGGHSLGGTIATAYATWDFNGQAGASDLSGLVLIDGGSGAGAAPTSADITQRLTALNDPKTSPFLDLAGLGLPWALGVLAATGSTAAVKDPDAASQAAQFKLLPSYLKPPGITPTNAAEWGYAVDTKTGPKNLALVQMHLGHLAASGDPRPWVDGGLVPVKRSASLFAGIPGMDGAAWYFPSRLSLDAATVNDGLATPAQKLVGVRATHGRDLDIPIYAFATSLGNTRVLKGAQALAKQSGLKKSDLTLVNRASTYAHIDPLAVPAAKNAFFKALIPFLKKVQ
jgi:pimeloyl-ACP methyl ester carboxylesterase